MDWKKVFEKSLLAMLTYLTAGIAVKPEFVLHISEDPKKAIPLLIGSFIAGALVGITNFIKHRNTK